MRLARRQGLDSQRLPVNTLADLRQPLHPARDLCRRLQFVLTDLDHNVGNPAALTMRGQRE
jgi:hypothetical protein